MPESLRSTIPETQSQTIFVLISPPVPDLDILRTILAPFAPTPPPAQENENDASSNPPESQTETDTREIPLYPLRIPLQPPLNTRQAERWTKNLWPVILNPAAPRANVSPPPQLLNRTLDSIKPRAGYYLALAQKVAHEADDAGLGRRVGAVVVDPAIEATITHEHELDSEQEKEKAKQNWTRAIVAVAGDARYNRREAGQPSQAEAHAISTSTSTTGFGPNPASQTYNADLEGGPELHALMRGIEMVSRRRRDDTLSESSPDGGHLTPLESHFLYHTDDNNAPPPSISECPCPADEISPVPEKLQKLDTTTAHPTKTAAATAETDTTTATTAAATGRIRPRALGGYLCTDMDIYLTHEPCLSCCMGLLLSRCRAIIFPRNGRMVTGGVASEPVVSQQQQQQQEEEGNEDRNEGAGEETQRDKSRDPRNNRKYYGLHWRKELNWRALGFEFVADGYLVEEMGIEGEDGVAFHA